MGPKSNPTTKGEGGHLVRCYHIVFSLEQNESHSRPDYLEATVLLKRKKRQLSLMRDAESLTDGNGASASCNNQNFLLMSFD